MSSLCAVIKEPSLKKIEYANHYCDAIEFRLDLLKSFNDLEILRNHCKIPVIFTIKGGSPFPFLKWNPEYIDLDYQYPKEVFEEVKQKFPHITIIASKHGSSLDFDDLMSLPGDIYKGVFPAKTTSDALKMLLFAKKQVRPFIPICTNDEGSITRILAPIVRSPFIYAPITEEDRTAEGQLLVSELLGIYRTHQKNQDTEVFGLIGNPISQSPGHLVHNFAFEQLGMNAVYVKMKVEKDELFTFLELAKEFGFSGLSVTIPHKEKVGEWIGCDVINTLCFKKNRGFNTDGRGACDLIEMKRSLKNAKVLILGTGGSALGIGKEITAREAKVTFLHHQRKLHSSFPMFTFKEHEYDILINATTRSDIISFDDLREDRLVMDLSLLSSPLLEAAEKKGCAIIEGRDLFFKQAQYQYEHWFCSSSF